MIPHNFDRCGICIYSKPPISITVLDYTYEFQEYICCSVSLSKDENLLLFCIYRSPSSADANDLNLCSMLEDVLHTNYSDTVVVVVVVCPLQPSSSVNSGCPGPESSVLVSSRWACP